MSQYLSLLNPFQLAQIVRQIWGEANTAIRWQNRPPTVESYRQHTNFTLPFEGEWLVANGGTDEQRSHSWDILGQRYAYDFLVVDEDERSFRDMGSRLGEYLAYGRSIVAPADGVVVQVRDGVRDAANPGTGKLDWLCTDIAGNHVTIKHAEREHSFLAHLIPNSIVVREGQHVRRGELLGRCGNSGHSTEPHLHFQVQDTPTFLNAMSLPIAFSAFVVDGAATSAPVYIQRGSRVAAADPVVGTS